MRFFCFLALVILCSTFSAVSAQKKDGPVDLKGKTVQQKFEELLPGMGAEDIKTRFGPQQEWQAICYKAGAPGNEKLRLEVCKLMIAKLGSQTPDQARLWLLTQLEFLGRGEAVDSVAALLKEKNALIHDAAVRCLANNPAPEGTAKLIAALPGAEGKARIGLINALGYRADRSAVKALAKELEHGGSKEVMAAAAKALGKIASPEAMKVLASLLVEHDFPPDRQLWIADAYLLCADRLLREGKTAQAKEIYSQLAQSQAEARSTHLAAFQGILKTASDDEVGPLILKKIAGNDADRKSIATAQIESIGPVPLKYLAANIDKLPPPSQVTLLGALAARKDKSQLPVALAAFKNKEESVQRAGILALGKLGDVSVVKMLLDLALGNSKLSGVARDSLTVLASDGVDEQIVAALKQEKEVPNRKALIGILEARRAVLAVPVLLEDASGSDAGLRTSALTALRQLAEPAHVPALVEILLKAEKTAEREEVERTIVAVCGKIAEPEKRADPVLEAVKKAAQADRNALLPLLGRLGNNASSLDMIRQALAGDNPELREAGIQAICNWPIPNVSEDLIKLIQDARTPAHRQLGLRSLVRINSATSEKPDNASRLKMLKKAMDLGESDNDKRLVLDGLRNVKDIGTLRYVLPFLDQKDLAQTACRTIVELAQSKTLREPYRAEFDRALDRVISICQDKGLVERAKRYKQGS